MTFDGSVVGPSSGGRITGLDGLRGLAALVVVVLHSLLLSTAFTAPNIDPRPATFGDAVWWFTYTPLHLLWDGSAAVLVFFVLSGFVLSLPARRRRIDWLSYYPSRFVRLYLPVWAAVGVALIWTYTVPHLNRGSAFVQVHTPPGLRAIAGDLILLVPGWPGRTNSVLWSLKWEVAFSILLPLFVLFAARVRKLLWLKIVLIFVLMTIGAYLGPAEEPYALNGLFQLPIFAIGALLAFEWDRVIALRDTWRRPRAVFGWLAVAAGLLVTSYWSVFALPLPTGLLDALAPITRVLQVVGAALAVVIAAASPDVSGFLSRAPLRWLGTRSFSVYLMHEPMVVALGRLTGEPVNPLLTLAITIPVALGLAELFFRIIERPSHRLARHLAQTIRRRRSPIAPTSVEPATEVNRSPTLPESTLE